MADSFYGWPVDPVHRLAAKRAYMSEYANDSVTVCIYDRPESFLFDLSMTPEQLEEWRYADRIARGIHVEVARPVG